MSVEVKQASPRIYAVMQKLFRAVAFFLLKQEVSGLENIPAEGPFLLVVNHLSILEPPVVFIHCPRQLVVFAADKWRTTPVVSHIANLVGVIWVARGEADTTAIKSALHLLKTGGALGMAPEGTRSPTRQLQKGKTGAAYLADRAGVPIVPVGISGTEAFRRNLKRLRRTSVRCVIGQPFHLAADGRATGDKLQAYTELIMCRIAALLPPEYRGAYARHPQLRELLGGRP